MNRLLLSLLLALAPAALAQTAADADVTLPRSAAAEAPATEALAARPPVPEAPRPAGVPQGGEAWRPASAPLRVSGEVLGGALLGTAGFAGGLLIGSQVGHFGTVNGFNWMVPIALGGSALGTSLGVWGAGSLAGGHGALETALLGSVVGGGSMYLVSSLLFAQPGAVSVPGMVLSAAGVFAGAVAGYELSSSALYEDQQRKRQALRLVVHPVALGPSLAPGLALTGLL